MKEQEYVDTAHHLTTLLGWRAEQQEDGTTVWIDPETELPSPLPDWANNGSDALNLAIKIGLKVDCTDTDERFICYVYTSHRRDDPYVAEHYEDHKSRDLSYEQGRQMTVRFAIMRAAIVKLEAKLEQSTQAAPHKTATMSM